jgi:hypothetical protein
MSLLQGEPSRLRPLCAPRALFLRGRDDAAGEHAFALGMEVSSLCSTSPRSSGPSPLHHEEICLPQKQTLSRSRHV